MTKSRFIRLKLCKNGWDGAFSHELAPLSQDLKFIESLWEVLEETLHIAGLLHCQYKILTNIDAPLDENNIT